MDRICISLLYVTIVLLLLYVSASPPNISTDQSALVALKSHLSLSFDSILASNWSIATPVCSWIGVTCGSRHHRVIALNISGLQLTGTISPHLGNLSFLTSLDMSNNSLYGTLPQEMGDLHRLIVLNLQINQLTGPISPSIFNISSLQIIKLSKNKLSGNLPINISHQTSLIKHFQLGVNSLVGSIPSSLGKCSLLQTLSLHDNNMEGEIPKEIGNLQQLQIFSVEYNDLIGPIPISLFNISTLRILALTENHLSGDLPSSLGHMVPNLERVYFARNNFSGVIPDSISNASQLISLTLAFNSFTGVIPHSLGNLRLLRSLYFGHNNFQKESSSSELSFLTYLTRCRNLEVIAIFDNPLNGILPSSIGNFSKGLKTFFANICKLKGEIPKEIGKLSNLIVLALGKNELTGSIPVTIKGLESVQEIIIGYNNITGLVPNSLCHLKNLGSLVLEGNDIYGPLPKCIGNITALRYLYLASNRFTSLPASLWNLHYLLELNVSSNQLSGHLSPEIGNLYTVIVIDLSMNNFLGNIPSTMGALQNLINVSFAHNRLEGSIPESFGQLVSLEALDVSYNSITGVLPMSLENLKYLYYFNVSFNKLSGEIPNGGPFLNFTSRSFMSNTALCGASRFQVPPCHNNPTSRRKIVHITIYILGGVAGMILALVLGLLLVRWQRKEEAPSQLDTITVMTNERISFLELVQATDGFNESNLLGKGSYGTVYQGVLCDGTQVAVKVFDTHLEGAMRSFDTECKALCNLRHRNIAKVITICSNTTGFKSLVLEYMPNGSLEKWLYSHNYFLNILQRLNIMIDVASALDYLHNGHSNVIVHCDLKPSNVLLNKDMVGHVSDFGIAKLLGGESSAAQTKTLATIAYMAPEYGQQGFVSKKCDVYSFGIMLMETFTRVKPGDDMFAEELSLRSWISNSIPNSIIHVVDTNLVRPNEQNFEGKVECLLSIMELAIHCSAALPKERLDMKDVVTALKKIRTKLEEQVEH